MNIQFVTDNQGDKNAVQLSLKEWNQIQDELKELRHLRECQDLYKELKEAIDDITLFEKGEKYLKTANELLDEL